MSSKTLKKVKSHWLWLLWLTGSVRQRQGYILVYNIIYQQSLAKGNTMNTCFRAKEPDNNTPSKTISILFVFLLLFIHTLDMWLTRYEIGNEWEREIFLPMRYCIKWLGIYGGLWVSRICIYSMLFAYFLNWKKWKWHYFLVTGTILYWASMIPWLRTLGYTNWP